MPAGVGKDNELRVWRDEQPSYNDENPVLIDYKQPVISGLKTDADSPLVKVKGEGMYIKISGEAFWWGFLKSKDEITSGVKLKTIASLAFGGIDLLSPQFNVRWKCVLNGAHCSEDFEIRVKLPEGQGGLHELSLEVGGQKPASPRRLDYEEPKVDDVVPSQVSTQGGDKIVIKGKNLGCTSSDPFKLCAGHDVDFSNPDTRFSLVVPCPVASGEVSVNEVNCTIGEGQGKDLTLHFTINKLKIATAPLHQMKKKNCLSLSPVSMIMMRRREFSLRA